MAKGKFYTRNGKETDVLHSYGWYKGKASMRNAMAFDKVFLDSLSQRDRNLMRGYAQAKVEQAQAFRYNNPNYQRKTKGNGSKPNIAAHFQKYSGR